MKEWFTKERITAWGQILLGCLLGAMAYPWFLVPNHIAPGGVTGLATVLNYLFGWPVGTASLLMNIPLFLIGYRSMGRTFAVRSLGATVIFSLLIDFLPLQPMTHDPLLGSLFGGVLLGVGLGFVIKGGATTGGTDMAARVIHQRIPYLSVGVILFIIDCLVVLLAGFQIQAEYALYAFICLYSSSKLIDVVMNGLTTEKACFINSLHGKEIKQALMDEIGRMERHADTYSARIRTLLDGCVPILGVVQKKADTPLAAAIRSHPNVRLIEVSEENRDVLLPEILSALRS